MQEILGGLRERYERVDVQDKGGVFNTELMEAVELGYLLDCAETRSWQRPRPRREPRRPLPGGSPLRDDANWLKHTLAYREDDGRSGSSTSR